MSTPDPKALLKRIFELSGDVTRLGTELLPMTTV